MDFLKDNIKTIYFKYLAASFGSTLITSIYGIVDMAMAGADFIRRCFHMVCNAAYRTYHGGLRFG